MYLSNINNSWRRLVENLAPEFHPLLLSPIIKRATREQEFQSAFKVGLRTSLFSLTLFRSCSWDASKRIVVRQQYSYSKGSTVVV